MRVYCTLGIISLLLMIGLILPNCGSEEKPPLDYGKCKCEIDESLSQSHQSSGMVTNGAIYLDLSTSMQGYISDPKSQIPFTLLQHMLHNVLQTSFHHIGISKPDFKGFGRHIVEVDTPMKYFAGKVISEEKNEDGKPKEIHPRSRFIGAETNIVGVLLEAAKNESTLSVIVTDGGQDVHGLNGELAPGFDRPEFIQAICSGLIDRGFGVWLMGIMNAFDGNYYNIIPNRNGEVNKPLLVKGRRPVYCWLVSKDITNGRKFVQFLYEDMTRLAKNNYVENGGYNQSLVQVIEITPGIYPKISLMESKPHKHFQFDDKTSASLALVRDWGTHPDQDTTKVAAANFMESGNDLLFLLQAQLKFDVQYTWNSFPSRMWQIAVENPNSLPWTPLTEIPGAKSSVPENMRFIFLKFPSNRLIVLQPEERLLELPVCLYADLELGLENCWIKGWSTIIDNKEEYIQGKTLYLYDIISTLLNHSIGKKRVGACLRLALIKGNG